MPEIFIAPFNNYEEPTKQITLAEPHSIALRVFRFLARARNDHHRTLYTEGQRCTLHKLLMQLEMNEQSVAARVFEEKGWQSDRHGLKTLRK